MSAPRADNCDCDDGTLLPGLTCGKPECHRTRIANASLKSIRAALLATGEANGACDGQTFCLPDLRTKTDR